MNDKSNIAYFGSTPIEDCERRFMASGHRVTPSHQRVDLLSDNCAPPHPDILAAINQASGHFYRSYGADEITAKAADQIRSIFDSDCSVFFVATGVAANGLSLAAICPPHRSIICHRNAHVVKDECGAVPFFAGGATLHMVDGANLKISPERVLNAVKSRTDIHFQKPAAITFTQATEAGTVYSKNELSHLRKISKENGLYIHVDGARLANAAAFFGISPKEMIDCSGVDILTLGGSKNGIPFGEAIVIFNPVLRQEFGYRIKQSGHLISRVWMISTAWFAALEDNLWINNAQRANAAASYLAKRLGEIPEISVPFPVQSNLVLISGSEILLSRIARDLPWASYPFIINGMLRFACSWCTTASEIDAVTAAILAIIEDHKEKDLG
ncbi:beta-eliminating lyase-related protein [Mesorhizobium sp. RMAD-H1]|uniref:threonine aldolase family protein n=1 Tax=Mesorhizobium sp. RMAD-H1 TaxID=2587065 RepID=UPI00161A1D3B|nr:beta-eliminating lyase-related protein [Mesorhizobium sp. RMAD-H1]MBB2974279.1 threonine aldolase [Mesorhizobium sp. RMAD-H1]